MGDGDIQRQLLGCSCSGVGHLRGAGVRAACRRAVDVAGVTVGTRLVDAGCGAGLLALRASLRGAQVGALEASRRPT